MLSQHLISRFAGVLGLALGMTVASMASPTGLITIPTADLAPAYEVSSSFATNLTNSGAGLMQYNRVGILNFMEVGADYDDYAGDIVGAVKVSTQLKGLGGTFAAGVDGLGLNNRTWYMVYSSDIDDTAPVRFHTGILDPQGTMAPFLGLELPLLRNATFMLEGVAGDISSLTGGVKFNLMDLYEVKTGLVVSPKVTQAPVGARYHVFVEVGRTFGF